MTIIENIIFHKIQEFIKIKREQNPLTRGFDSAIKPPPDIEDITENELYKLGSDLTNTINSLLADCMISKK